jgi:hypothetical protein
VIWASGKVDVRVQGAWVLYRVNRKYRMDGEFKRDGRFSAWIGFVKDGSGEVFFRRCILDGRASDAGTRDYESAKGQYNNDNNFEERDCFFFVVGRVSRFLFHGVSDSGLIFNRKISNSFNTATQYQ